MPNRRDFMKGVMGATAAVLATGRGFLDAATQQGQGRGQGQGQRPSADTPVAHRDVRVGGKRVKVVDIHAHATFPEVAELVKDGPLARSARGGGRRSVRTASRNWTSAASMCRRSTLTPFGGIRRTAIWPTRSSRHMTRASRNGAKRTRPLCGVHFAGAAVSGFGRGAARARRQAVGHARSSDRRARQRRAAIDAASTIRSGPRRRSWACWCSCILAVPRTS